MALVDVLQLCSEGAQARLVFFDPDQELGVALPLVPETEGAGEDVVFVVMAVEVVWGGGGGGAARVLTTGAMYSLLPEATANTTSVKETTNDSLDWNDDAASATRIEHVSSQRQARYHGRS